MAITDKKTNPLLDLLWGDLEGDDLARALLEIAPIEDWNKLSKNLSKCGVSLEQATKNLAILRSL